FGNPGQADYAAANSFLDAFARERNRLVAQGERSGRTVSIAWPLWRDGGMQLDAAYAELLKQSSGLTPMPAAAGCEAFHHCLGSGLDHVLVLHGDPARLREKLLVARETDATAPPADVTFTQVLDVLAAMVSEQQKVPLDRIEPDAKLPQYGFDSLAFTEFANTLNRRFGLDLMPTLFFERSSLRALAGYLVERYPAQFSAQLRPAPVEPLVAPADSPAINTPAESVPIAVIGMSGRFPGAADVDEFWKLIAANRDMASDVPADRWDWRAIYGDALEEPGKTRVHEAGFLEGVDQFDPAFFGVSPREAIGMDPQLRLLLETVWATIEDAGYRASDLAGRPVGVFMGVSTSDYKEAWLRHLGSHPNADGPPLVSHFVIANRISYALDLRGPSEPIDTACSSSLIAIHRAIAAIRMGHCESALVGGVNVILTPDIMIGASRAGMLSEDGRCRTFDASANGYGRGEGVAALLLKPLDKALADGDHIYCLIRGSAENHGGKAASPTAPNSVAQQALLVDAYTRSGIDPRTVGYIEAHGTGTKLGDAVEIDGLKAAFAELYEQQGAAVTSRHCALGSVKTNIGHLEAAAGMAGMIKVIQMLRHRRIPGNPHLQEPNPYLRLEGTPFYLARETREWAAPLRAGVSSFGIGGSNAHVIVEAYTPEPATAVSNAGPQLIVLSAKTHASLKAAGERLLAFLQKEDCPPLADIAWTLQVGREPMGERFGFVASTVADAVAQLTAFVAGQPGEPATHNTLRSWLAGADVDWAALHNGPRRRVSLPSYCFSRKRYWFAEEQRPAVVVAPRQNVASRNEIAETLAGMLAEVLYLDLNAISLSDSFTQLGLDSVTGVEWIHKVNKQYGLKLPATRIYDHSTLLAFAEHVAGQVQPVVTPKPIAPPPLPTPARPPAEHSLEALQDSLRASLGAALYMDADDVAADVPFTELGLDSIVSVEWIQSVNKQYGLKIPATRVYDCPTIVQFAAHLQGELGLKPAAPQPSAAAPPPTDGIAIVGMSGRYPGAPDLRQYWDNLKNARNSVKEIPANRWDVRDYFDPDPSKPGKIYCKWLGALDDIDCFDTSFFSIPPAEAEAMDPQHRIFLEESYKAFEDAGYSPQALSGARCGVYMGIMNSEYVHLLNQQPSSGLNTGNSFSIAAARIAYHLNLKGPAIPIDTACSSSLVAAHLACQALRNGEIDMALAGGVTLYLTPASYVGMCAAGMLSADGQCKSFDDSANGFVPGEGVGLVVLKRLADALRVGDTIHGVIIGSGINQDGRTNGITAPSVQSQIELERDVYQRFGIDPESISYIETHGTGTQLGDPIELEALTTVFREKTARRHFCALGAAKSNIGHTSAAAGMAGVHKAVLSLRHRQLAPSLHFQKPNSHCDFDDSPFYVNTRLKDWENQGGRPRRAAVSSFGFSGTNAHLVIEEYAKLPVARANPRPVPIVLSARDEERLRDTARQLVEFLVHSDPPLSDFAYTLQVGRDGMQERLACVASSVAELREKLAAFLRDGSGVVRGRVPRKHGRLAFVDADEALLRQIRTQAQRGEYAYLLEQWVNGLLFDWNTLASEPRPSRISLPGYPFARERHWVKQAIAAAPAPPPPTQVRGPVALASPESLPMVFPSTVSSKARTHLAPLDAPLTAPELLLQHLSRNPVPVCDNALMQAALRAGTVHTGSSTAISLRSAAVKLEMFPDGVVLLTMRDEAGRNTFTEALSQGLIEAFGHVGRTPSIKVLVLTGYGHYFACGGTRDALLAIQSGAARFTDSRVTSLPLECEIPVIAAMQGHGIGAGWAMGLFCDGVLHSEESIYHSPYLQYGFTPGAGSTLVFPYHFGSALGRDILVSAREYKGRELRGFGAGMTVLPRAEVLPRALAAAHHLAGESRESLLQWKREQARPLRERLEATFAAEVAMHEKTFVGSDEVRAKIEATYGGSPAGLPETPAPKPAPIADPVNNDEALRAIVRTLRETLADELHLRPEKLDVEVAFVELGLDSINTITWLRELNQSHGISITAMEVYSHPTILELASHLLQQGHGVPIADPTPAPPPAPREVKRSDIAIIGMAGRFPASPDIESFWENLAAGRNCITEVPADRWPVADYFDADPAKPGKTYSKWMGAIEDIDKFDPLFFNIAPLEAEAMDPQQRLFLETCWSCIENAGYDPTKLAGSRCGVFAGCGPGDYGLAAAGGEMDAAALTGGSMSILAARISYFLNLQGPCVALDTACSASLVAVATACDSLLLGNSDLALAGGVSIMASPMMHIMTSKAGMLSPDGRCYTFDQRANGFVPGEGVGVILLKRLEDAERDGDRIDAVIRGWGVNQDGKTNGITAPNGDSQTRLEKYVYDRFALNPDGIQLVEAHGTGTKLGDPIEVAGLVKAFRAYTGRDNYCALGSVKSNIGHLLAAAGVAGVIKAALALRHRTLPPTIHFETLNERIEVSGSPFYVNTVARAWEVAEGMPRRAAVSGFGFSGTNAHVVIEEYSGAEVRDAAGPVAITLSAKNADRLREQASNLLRYVQNSACSLQDLAYTLQVGRTAFPERLAFVADSLPDVASKLKAYLAGEAVPGLHHRRVKPDRDALPKPANSRDLRALVGAWTNGAEVDWTSLHAAEKRQRLALPTYPFARERYWIGSTKRTRPQQATLLCRPVWRAAAPAALSTGAEGFAHHVVLLCGSMTPPAAVPGVRYMALPGRPFEAVACQAFDALKELLREHPRQPILMQALVEDPILLGLAGLFRTAMLEHPNLRAQVILVATGAAPEQAITENRACADAVVRYTNWVREVLRFEELTSPEPQPCWQDNGVYLITGGSGALARLFAVEIAARTLQPTIILAGRGALTTATQQLLETLARRGATAEYRQADVTDEGSVAKLIGDIQSTYGRLDGVLHAAGTSRDNMLTRKSTADFEAVLAAKVRGTVLLEGAVRPLAPKLFVLFSSCAGAAGNTGQADYATANAFLDAFAHGPSGTRMVSIDWPLWKQGGMHMDDGKIVAIRAATGAEPLETEAAMQAFYRAVASGLPQVMVLSGDLAHLRQTFFPSPKVEEPDLRPRVVDQLKSLFGETIRLAKDRFEEEEPLENYGIDSILITQLNQRLTQVFPSISQTLLFDVRHLGDLADALLKLFRAECQRWTGVTAGVSAVALPQPVPSTAVAKAATPVPTPGTQEPIAIIGISGRYADAESLDAFWNILQSGRDCVTEIPAERWPLDGFYQPDPDKAIAQGKSYGKWGSFLNTFADFDPLFFNIPPVQAMGMDPHERLFLETCWEAVESAGYTRERIASATGGQVGVFAGITKNGFERNATQWKRQGVTPHTSFGSVANRVSYFLNLHGPSMPVDTMCSSSLTAIHEACQSLRQGECRMAIAGGVNLYLHPSSFVELSAQRMLSADGRCKSFGAGGNGFAPGEGVGAVLLKPLPAALTDGDPIHAVIRGTHVNHGGKTNGYTVPNPTAQGDLVRETLRCAGVNARHVTCIEAHGTGTELGDPIEVSGLTQAFRPDTAETGFCALGSVKSNLGHLEAAAGIAGLTKVILQMKHGRIAPSLHAREPNKAIPFAETPFVVAQELTAWERPSEGGTRLAGVSSFGAGGSNAHVLLEEPPRRPAATVSAQPEIIVLSAKTEERLVAYAQRLYDFLGHATPALRDLAFTLQAGREAMAWRLGFIAGSLDEVKQTLRGFLENHPQSGVVRGHVEKTRGGLAKFSRDEDIQAALEAWHRKRKLAQLLEVWVSGTTVDWARLHAGDLPRRIELPTYPFARERYWIPYEQAQETAAGESKPLHPLVHRNTSDLSGLRFTTVLTGDEFFVADHVIGGQAVLPGVAVLEMARAAVELVAHEPVSLQHVAWTRPVAVTGDSRALTISVQDKGAGRLRFEVCAPGDDVPYAQGLAVLGSMPEAGRLDVDKLRRATAARFDAAACYAAFQAMGVHYGPAQQSIAELFVGGGQILARLTLPAAASGDAFQLHPSLMDGALQACIGFALQNPAEGQATASVPFALEELLVYTPCANEMWAWIQQGPKLAITLCDAAGRVCLSMQGLTFRSLSAAAPASGLVLAAPRWEPAAAAPALLPDYQRQQVFAAGEHSESFEAMAARVFALVREWLRQPASRPMLLQVVVPAAGDASLGSGLTGLLRTAHLEQPLFHGQVIETDAFAGPAMLADNAAHPDDLYVRYEAGVRHVQRWREVDPPASGGASPWKSGGVYWITGGAGSIGRAFAEHIVAQQPTAKVILSGRSALNAEQQAWLEKHRGSIVYHRADVSRIEEVERLVAEHGRINGVLHAAGITRDKLIVRKSAAEFDEVLSPKVTGVRNLDRATRHLDLDFFALFAAGAGVLGNPGQADYATANAYLDSFAAYRNQLVAAGERRGPTFSIDWPYWQDGGMRMDAASQSAMKEKLGLVPITTATGIAIFEHALRSQHSQILALTGDPARLRALLGATSEPAPGNEPETLPFLRGLLSTALNVPAHRLRPDESFSEFGIDSIVAMNLTHKLEDTFGSLPKTLFFEYQTLAALARYFTENHAGKLRRTPAAPPPPAPQPQQPAPQPHAGKALDIAIIGLSGRYPLAPDLDVFWNNLRDGQDCITEVPASRWNWRDYFPQDGTGAGTHRSKWGGFLDDVDKFDAQFFSIPPRIAPFLDPQERLVLEETWKALEDAGYRPKSLQTDGVAEVGVYIGSMYSEYQLLGAELTMAGTPAAFAANPASLANRVSYFLNLHGPSMTVDTMCSSSLTSIHLACQDLKLGHTRMAIAGGVNLTIHPNKYLMLSGGQFISTEGRCESFGEGGDGYIPSEGVGIVILKRLADAERDGDNIYGVIKGSALNHGGRTNGYSVPNPNAQRRVVVQALEEAGVDPRAVSYVEAHGTGTKLGDPIEVAGLAKAFGLQPGDGHCLIGSVKSNIGHCEAAAGVAGLTKILLQMRHRQIVPSIHSRTLNPNIDFAATPFEVNQALRPWQQAAGGPRIAGLSSFGAGGSNAHLVVEEYAQNPRPVPATPPTPAIIVLSAKNEQRLRDTAANLAAFLDRADLPLEDIAYTLQVGREPMEERLGFTASSLAEIRSHLRQYLSAGKSAFRQPAILADWLSGKDVDWESLHRDGPRPRRVSLPGAVFVRQRYWIDRPTSATVALPAAAPVFEARNGERVRFELAPLDGVSTPPPTPPDIDPPEPPSPSAPPPPPAQPAEPAPEFALALASLEEKLRASLAETLFMGADEIKPETPFLDLGLDSIVAVEWIKQINRDFQLDIQAGAVYEHLNLRRFTAFLQSQIQGEVPSVPTPAAPLVPTRAAEPAPAPPSVVSTNAIAVVGMSGRFPGAPDLNAFWRMLEKGDTAFSALPRDRGWDLDAIYAPEPQSNKTYVRRGAFLDSIDCFAPLFFQISPKEARTMDPAERLFLEEAWHALEDAGLDPGSLSGRNWGVFCGNGGDYSLRIKEVLGFSPHVTLSQVPARVAHFFNLQGPCQSVDAGCASSLLAVAEACDQLLLGRCEAAIAGGALIHSTPNLLISACQIELLSRGDSGRALDAEAQGMMPGEAVGVVVLKRLADAIASGDHIHGVIEGWSSNHNGRTNGMVAPNADAQAALFEGVYSRFAIDAGTITLVEANASGMPQADAAEIQALTRVLHHPFALSTVENNIGHAFHASGICHLMKVLLAIRHGQIPATPGVNQPRTAPGSPFTIHSRTTPWDAPVRRAAVSSFGATGTNAHLVVSGAPSGQTQTAPVSDGPVLIVLSARNAGGLPRRAGDLRRWLEHNDVDLRQLSANLLLRRTHFEERCAIVVSDIASLSQELARIEKGQPGPGVLLGSVDADQRVTPALSALAASTREDLLILADLYTKGVKLDLAASFQPHEKAVLSLPGYPFEKRRCWISDTAGRPAPERSAVPTSIDRLTALVCELTGLAAADIRADKPLSLYGVDSLLSMRLLNRINDSYRAEFDASLLRHDTLETLAKAVDAALDTEPPPTAAASSPQRPDFIESVDLEPRSKPELISAGQGEAQLERLLQMGAGVWEENGLLRFEFLKGTQTRETLQAAVTHPRSLLASLEKGARYYPASHMQRFALDAAQLHGSTAFHIGQAFWLDTPADVELLNRAYNDITRRHAILRTGFRRIGEQWAQVVSDSLNVTCREQRWPQVTDRASFLAALETFQKQQLKSPYDLNHTPLLDVFLVHNTRDLAAVYFQTHHSHADGFTLFLFQQELYRRYRALQQHAPWPEAPQAALYAHFALTEFDAASAANTVYWTGLLDRNPQGASLQDRAEHLESVTRAAGLVTLESSPLHSAELSEGCRRLGITLTQLVSCAVALLTYRLTLRSMPIQMVYNLRDRVAFETVLGDFSSSAPLLLSIEPGMKIRQLFEAYQEALLAIQTHKRFDFVELIGRMAGTETWSGISIDSNNRDSLCEVTDFASRLIDIPIEGREPVAPLVVCLVQTGGRLDLQLIYDRSRLSTRTMQLFAQAVNNLLPAMIADPDQPAGSLPVPQELLLRLAGNTNRPEPERPLTARVAVDRTA
ncbi:MAG: SDR family NAD(P)-dependent oxidoreductase, partial [Bryobacterales bacterium]|nr:SDR family NAD(P)-dependent oxidoreductase [Bryobacterales bacterium]